MSSYVHWIDLYDEDNRRIDPTADSPAPYSPERTCGRCHDFNTISHGWHFNAVNSDAFHGRPGQPWVWSDERTGTHLQLSYRDWDGTFNPDELGISRWQVAAKLGGFLPGGGPGSAESLLNAQTIQNTQENADPSNAETATDELPAGYEDRSSITGPLPVDCMLCHHRSGSGYSPFVWTEQIEDENFSYAPTAAVGLAVVEGNMRRLKEGFDTKADGSAAKLPKVTYETHRFRSDGKVFFDLIRRPENDACYYCHTNANADSVAGTRWLHDEDIHVRAGIRCADCHRNGLNHDTVRGYEGEQHSAGEIASSLSCQGCHMGEPSEQHLPGRLGAPRPAHKGLPPLHFEKMTCTACHSGTMPAESVPQQINSIAHRLGEHIKRTGNEAPAIFGPVIFPPDKLTSLLAAKVKAEESITEAGQAIETTFQKYTPHRMLWPSYWGIRKDGKITPLHPEDSYELVRKSLKVRQEFTSELGEVKISLTQRKEILGEERARAKPEDWTPAEQQKISVAEDAERKLQVAERMSKSLAAIEEAYPGVQAVYVSAGVGFVLDGEMAIKELPAEELGNAGLPYAWPQAHNVRPAQQSLGITGCTECHSEGARFFESTIQPIGLLPSQVIATQNVRDFQGVDEIRLSGWNSLFQGRSLFKVLGIVALGLTCLLAISACAINLNDFWRGRKVR